MTTITINKTMVMSAISKVLNEKGHFPNRVEMAEVLMIPISQVNRCMMALVEAGKLAQVGGWYCLSYEGENSEVIETVQEPLEMELNDNYILALQATMCFVGIGAVIISIYYTSIWLIEYLPFILAVLLSTIMISFSSTLPEVILTLRAKKIAHWASTSLLCILWVVVTSFSIMSTVVGQYNKHVINLREQAKTGVQSDHLSWNSIQERKVELQKSVKETRDQLQVYNNILSGMNTVESRTANNKLWNDTRWSMSQANEQMTKLSKELSDVRQIEAREIERSRSTGNVLHTTTSSEIQDAYGWMSTVFHISSDNVQFWMYLFPAIFVDIIAPVALAIAMFLRRKVKSINTRQNP